MFREIIKSLEAFQLWAFMLAGETGLEPAADGFGVRAKAFYKIL